ncbi:hypothetical protein OY671_002775 [Metschnikowia pulcherrima]|nr:hypothetical protein OY671_002775 [Metschnikowia pulcherrima]
MLTTSTRPTSGTATVAGHDVVAEPDAVRHRIGYVGQGNGAGHAQRAVDELASQGRIHGSDRRSARRRADESLDSLELTAHGTRKVSDLSGGQRRRLDVAMGLVHAPSLLFLDEPSTGLDPHNRANSWEHVSRMRDDARATTGEPMTIVLTTHYLDEADTMAERVVVVDHGRVIADDTAANLKAELAGDRVLVTLAPSGGRAHDDAAHLTASARRVEGFREVTRTPEGAGAVGPDAGPDTGPDARPGSAPALDVRAERGDAYSPRSSRAADAAGIAVDTAQPARGGRHHGGRSPPHREDRSMSTVITTPTRPRTAPSRAHAPRRGPAAFARDTGIVLVRESRPVSHDPFSVLFGLVQPIVFLASFGPLLVGSLGGTTTGQEVSGGNVWQWFVPSILVMTTSFGTSTTGANLLVESQTGAHERMLVAPSSRASLLVGRALKEMVPIVAQSVVVVLVMSPFGFESHPAGAVVGSVSLAVFGVGIGSLSYALALAVRKQDWMFWVVQQTLVFPLMISSGMLSPLETGPRWMQVASDVNPSRYVVDAERALFAGDLTASAVAWGWVAAVVTAAVGLAVGIRTMVRTTD